MLAINIIIQGLITGILLTLSFGAGFFALVQTSITRGYKKGLLIAFGAILCDIVYIGFSIFATSLVSEELPKYAETIKTVALIAFLFLGIRTILKSSKVAKSSDVANRPNYFYISKGIFLNLLNPLVLITWLGITIFLESNLKYGKIELFLFFASVFISTFASQTAVCYFSHKIKNYLSELFIHRMNIIIGIIFIAAGIVLFMSGSNTQAEVEKAREFLK